jgi:hypothetical protein
MRGIRREVRVRAISGCGHTQQSPPHAGRDRYLARRQQAARANEPATAEDLKIVVNDLKTVLRAEGRRTAVSGFVQNALFAALGIIAGVWFQKFPPF